MINKTIGFLMRVYRRSPLHSEKAGRFLAKILNWVVPVSQDQKAVKKINGIYFELDLNQVIDASLYYSGTFEEQVERLIASSVKPGMLAVDIGANIGYHTFQMAKLVHDDGLVYAIEPTKRSFDKLLRNGELNPDIKNIRYLKYALSDTNVGHVQAVFESSYRLDDHKDTETELVEMLTLDSIMEKEHIDQVDFIKIDVDGFEAKIIKGAHQTLAAIRRPILLMEVNPSGIVRNGDDPYEMADILIKLGYEFTTENGDEIQDLKSYCRQTYEMSTMIFGQAAIRGDLR